ncbi:MAG: hypothetical protein ACI4NW_00610 [Stenotrophomonas sp.]
MNRSISANPADAKPESERQGQRAAGVDGKILTELLGRCCAIGKVAADANCGPEKQAHNSTNSVIWLCFWPHRADKNVASALDDELKEDLEKDATDNAGNSSKNITSDFPEWHDFLVSGLTLELSRAAKRRRLE